MRDTTAAHERLKAKLLARAVGRGKPVPKPVIKPVPLPLVPCVHLGKPTGETVQCPSCRGTVTLKVMTCGIHGTCLPTKPVKGTACCVGCKDREGPT